MKQILGIWLPDGDEHFRHQIKMGPMIDGKATYQYRKYEEAMKHVRGFGHAVDVGGHVGLWSRIMAMHFDAVSAFEPLKEHRACFGQNVTSPKVTLFPYAVGDAARLVRIHMPDDNTGNSHVLPDKGEECQMVTLDSISLDPVDFLKIDVEGFELYVLRGAEETIRRDKPVICIEQKPNGNAERYGNGRLDAVDLLKSWGAQVQKEISGDFVLTW